MDCSLPGSSVHGILQARILEWLPFPPPGDLPDSGIKLVSCIAGGFFTTREALLLGIQFSSVTQSCPTLCDPMNCSTSSLPVHHQLPEFTQTHVHRVRDAIQPSHPLASPSPPVPNPSQHQSLSSESTIHIRWPKYWSFSSSPSNEYLALISFSIDWFDLLVIQGTLKSPLQNHSTKTSIFQCLAFFVVQLSNL